MANITYRITLIDEGLDTGPNYEVFTSVNCVDYTFLESITLEDVEDFADVTIDDSINCIRLYNNNAVCTNFRTIVVGTAPTTTTTTSAPTTTTTSTTTTTLPPSVLCQTWTVVGNAGDCFVRFVRCGTGETFSRLVRNATAFSGCFRERPSPLTYPCRIIPGDACTQPLPISTTTTTAGPTTTTTAGPTTTTTTTECPIDVNTCMTIRVFNPETVNTRTVAYLACGSRNISTQNIGAQQTVDICVVSGSIEIFLNDQNKCEGATVGRNIFNTSVSIIGVCNP
jgi:hypothetical protein